MSIELKTSLELQIERYANSISREKEQVVKHVRNNEFEEALSLLCTIQYELGVIYQLKQTPDKEKHNGIFN
jgi:hypothetical protein